MEIGSWRQWAGRQVVGDRNPGGERLEAGATVAAAGGAGVPVSSA